MALILIVDDSPTEVFQMRRMLENHGFETEGAADGAEGNNADYLWVYGRAGEKCLRCKKSVIRRAVHQGRATYFCPTCQTP